MGLAYERRGSGPPLVLLHGVGHRRQAWHPVMDLLTPHLDVIAVDLPGHGESPPLADIERPAVPAMAERILGFLDDLGLDRPHVAGNSLGGTLALMAAARHRASSVTALSPGGYWAHRWQFSYVKAVFGTAQLTGSALRPLIPALARSTAGRVIIDGAFVHRPSAMPAEQAIADAYAFFAARETVRAVLAEEVSLTEELPADVPVTIAWGAKDRVLSPTQARIARQRLPQARFVTLPACGHVPITDNPPLVAQILLETSTSTSTTGPT